MLSFVLCVGSESGYASSELGVSRDLWALLQGFYTKYPALAHNKLYVFGERSDTIGTHINGGVEPVCDGCDGCGGVVQLWRSLCP